jgi:ABC-2 type transport system permease protein
LSGFLYAIANMPTALQAFTYIIPARYYITVTRGIFLKGVGVNVLWGQALAMSLFAVIGISLATLAFRKEIAR